MSGATLWEEPQDPCEAASPSRAQGSPAIISEKQGSSFRLMFLLPFLPTLLFLLALKVSFRPSGLFS